MQNGTTFDLIPPPDDGTPIPSCPAENQRPTDLEQYRAASAAADGDRVEEIAARHVRTDMTIWFPDPAPGRWRTVKDADTVEAGVKTTIRFVTEPGRSSVWHIAASRPICQRHTATRNSDATRSLDAAC